MSATLWVPIAPPGAPPWFGFHPDIPNSVIPQLPLGWARNPEGTIATANLPIIVADASAIANATPNASVPAADKAAFAAILVQYVAQGLYTQAQAEQLAAALGLQLD